MEYVSVHPNLPSLVYGRKMEAVAKNVTLIWLKNTNKYLMVYSTSLYINAKYPHLGPTPDGIIVCDCHKVKKMKCPHKYRNGLKRWQDDKDFPLDESGQIKKDHM